MKVGFVGLISLVGQEEVVIKPLGKMLQGTRWCGWCKQLPGDGRIAIDSGCT